MNWTLQTRLMVTVIGFVSVLLLALGLATGTILSHILQLNLSARLSSQIAQIPLVEKLTYTASDILSHGRQEPGFLLVIQNANGFSGAYVNHDNSVSILSGDSLRSLALDLQNASKDTDDVRIEGLGEYRLVAETGAGVAVLAGLPLTELTTPLAPILTTVGLVTAGGLILLAVVLAFVIRRSLQPLRAVAETATRVAALPLSEGNVSISERVPASQTDDHTEIGQVGQALNTLLDHVDDSLAARHRNEERMRQFVADASHELRTPLASIRGYSELSLRAMKQGMSPLDAETSTQALERIQAQSLRMTALVEDLLLLARLEEGQELVYGETDIAQLVVEAVGDVRPTGLDHEWRVNVPDEPVRILGDAPRLSQVIVNLLANARTHTPAGTEVDVEVHREGNDAIVNVHDNGPGIPPEQAAELFERFSRGDNSRARQTGGTGLGLSIARAIVTAHDGTISVSSRPGDTTFTVRLPVHRTGTSEAQ